MGQFGWVLWLAAPLAVTALAAAWTWWRGRSPKELGTRAAMARHAAYLAALERATTGQPPDRAG